MKICLALLVITLATYETQATVPGTCSECTDFSCGPVCVDKLCSKEILIDDTDVLGCLNELNTTLNTTQNSIELLNIDIVQLGDEINSINCSETNATAQCDAVNSTVIIIEGDITNIENNIINIEGNITNIEGDITNIEGDISSLNITIQENTQCCQELNNTINNNLTLTDDPSGETLINNGIGPDFVIKRLLAGNGITITSNPTNLELNATVPTLIYAVYAYNSVAFTIPDLYLQPQGSSFPEAEAQQIIPVSGVLRNLYTRVFVAPLPATSLPCTVRVNGVDTALLVNIPAGSLTQNNLIDTVAVSAGDLLSIFCTFAFGAPPTAILASVTLMDS